MFFINKTFLHYFFQLHVSAVALQRKKWSTWWWLIARAETCSSKKQCNILLIKDIIQVVFHYILPIYFMSLDLSFLFNRVLYTGGSKTLCAPVFCIVIIRCTETFWSPCTIQFHSKLLYLFTHFFLRSNWHLLAKHSQSLNNPNTRPMNAVGFNCAPWMNK